MANNIILVFMKKGVTKYSHVAECRSAMETGTMMISTLYVRLLAHAVPGLGGRPIKVSMPRVTDEIPLAIMFRALGCTGDRDILEHIVYDYTDQWQLRMMELLKPSIQESFYCVNQKDALHHIGKRTLSLKSEANERIAYASSLLDHYLLPHVGLRETSRVKKTYFLGYIVHKLLMVGLSS
jgi:DNA-directed RNA polymerase II subunit RPB2